MNITHVKIANILGLRQLEFKPDKSWTIVEGPNASGKSSVLEAIRFALGIDSRHDATLLRKGAKRGEVVLVLDDETKIRRTLSQKRQSVEIERKGTAVRKPATWLKELVEASAFNPVSFLQAKPQERLKMLLELASADLDSEDVEAAVADLPEECHSAISGVAWADLRIVLIRN